MNKVIELKSFQGFDDIKFGMKVKAVDKILGIPDNFEEDDILEEIIETRGSIKLYFKENKFIDVWMFKDSNIVYKSFEIFEKKSSEVISFLEKESGIKAEENGGYINFSNLGICLGGFGKKRIPEGKVLILYSKKRANLYDRIGKV